MAAGRRLFAEHGYAAVSTVQIVADAGVTRGALYHHFADKRALFQAVHEQLEQELVDRIGAGIAAGKPPAGAIAFLTAGTDLFLDACEQPAFARIALLEAPSVLGWKLWREIDARYSMVLLSGVLSQGIESGELRAQPVVPTVHLLLGALGEAGLLLAAGTPRGEVRGPLLALLDGLRA